VQSCSLGWLDPQICYRYAHLLLRPQAPWGLATAEVASMLLLYFVVVPGALLVRRPADGWRYAFDRSLEDVVALSLARGLAVTVSYFSGAGAKHHRWAVRRNMSQQQVKTNGI